MAVPMWLTSFQHPGPFEKAVSENVSAAGARVIVSGRWQPNDSVVVLCSPGCIANAQVVYIQPLSQDGTQFAVGIRLQSAPEGWPVRASS